MIVHTNMKYMLLTKILRALSEHLSETADTASYELHQETRKASGENRHENRHLLPLFDRAAATASLSNLFDKSIKKIMDEDFTQVLSVDIDAAKVGELVKLILEDNLPADVAVEFAKAFSEPKAAEIPDPSELPPDDPAN